MLGTIILCSLILSSVACSRQAVRSEGTVSPLNAEAPLDNRPFHSVEQIKADPVVTQEVAPRAERRQDDLRREQARTAAAGLQDVFFNYDSWDLTEEAMQSLAVDAHWLLSHDDSRIRIEGHCDERGTAAYNLVLGEKRALAVRGYLHELGVPSQRLTVMSYGEAQPACLAPIEACYQENRRGHLVVTP